MSLTDKERAFLAQHEMDPEIIEALAQGRRVEVAGPPFMSWLRIAYAAGLRHKRAKTTTRRKLRLYGRARRTIRLNRKES